MMMCCFSEVNLFQLPSLNGFINIEVPELFEDSYYFTSFNDGSQVKIKRFVVNLNRNGEKENYVFEYNYKGLLAKQERHIHEDSEYTYLYDEKDRILSFGDFSYKYLDDSIRERYCRGNLQFKEILEFQKNKIIITIISYSKRIDDGVIIESGKKIYEYNFINDNLIDIICTSFNIKGVKIKDRNYLKLFYDNKMISRTQEYYGDKLRLEQTFEYQNNKLVKKSVSYPSDSAANYTAEFSDFDKYGNFQNYVEKDTTGIKLSLSRIIDYK